MNKLLVGENANSGIYQFPLSKMTRKIDFFEFFAK
jgi:hypothetical protein